MDKKRLNNWLTKYPSVNLGRNVNLPLSSKIFNTSVEIKDNVNINGTLTCKGSSNVVIGKYCDIAENLFIISSNHQLDKVNIQANLQLIFKEQLDASKGPVYIGNNVWIGDNVTILSGVTIGDGAVIGTGSIVTRDIPPFAIAVGTPARVIKYRFAQKIINKLIDVSWWHWNRDTIFNNKEFFTTPINDNNVDEVIHGINLENESDVTFINLLNNNSSKWLLDGWGQKESNFRWVEKKEAGLIFKVSNPDKYSTFSFSGYSYFQPQKVKIAINRKKIGELKIASGWNIFSTSVKNISTGVNTIRLFFEHSFSPKMMDQNSTDKRSLFCCFSWFKLI